MREFESLGAVHRHREGLAAAGGLAVDGSYVDATISEGRDEGLPLVAITDEDRDVLCGCGPTGRDIVGVGERGVRQPVPQDVGCCVQLLAQRSHGHELRPRTGARRVVRVLLGRTFQVGPLRAGQDGHSPAEVLLGGAVVEGEPPRAPTDVDPPLRHHDLLAVDALMGVLADEEVIRPFGDQGPQ